MDVLSDYVASNHGVIARSEALSLGVTPHQVSYQLRTGRWERIGPSVYRVAAAPPSWAGRARAAALSVQGLVSHRSALHLWNVDGYTRTPRGTVHVLRSHGDAHLPHRPGVIVHRSRQFDRIDAQLIHGIPVTGLTRSVLDSAAMMGRSELDRLLDAVIRQRLCGWDDLHQTLLVHSAQGRNGCGRLRRALEARVGAGLPDSRFNRLVGQLLTNDQLPEPCYEHEVCHQGRFVGRVDLAYPRHRLAIECDGAEHHMTLEAFVADPRRKNRLLVAGWQVLTFTWSDYTNKPDMIVETVRDILFAQ